MVQGLAWSWTPDSVARAWCGTDRRGGVRRPRSGASPPLRVTYVKRVLIANVVLVGSDSGTGRTMENIFRGYPADRLMQLGLLVEPEVVDTCITDTLFLAPSDVPVDSLFRRVVGRVARPASAASLNAGTSPSVRRRGLSGMVHDAVRGALDMSPVRISRRLLDEVRAFDPEVIYTCGGNNRVHQAVNRLAESLGIPVVLHLMDDWPETTYTTSWCARPARWKLGRELARTHQLARTNLAISDALARKYEELYETHYLTLMNPALQIVENASTDSNDPVRFVYAGSLELNRGQTLLQIAELLARAEESGGERGRLSLYVPPKANTDDLSAQFHALGAEVRDYLPPDRVSEVYATADVLVHVESLDADHGLFTRYSLSTKIPEYMAAAKPILAHLPDGAYGAEYLRVHGAGLVSSTASDLERNIRRLIDDADVRLALARRGLARVQEAHTLDKVVAVRNEALGNTLDS